ncbi:MAG: amino acid ABC transporter substrate-binding protein [Alphaproteobacteria bacterium 65-37]|nr:MAG: amino acid ABC transporter substrate-binding protein [Alphaproteobacteria bacterium 65-37]
MRKLVLSAALGLLAVAFVVRPALAGKDLDNVRMRGVLACGLGTGLPGFEFLDKQGSWHGLGVDVCRAGAVALFGDISKVKYVPTNAQHRFTALQAGEVDLLLGNATHTLTRDTALGFDFTGIYYFGGQAFLVPRKLGVKSALELGGASICVTAGTTTELVLADYFRLHKMSFKPVVIEKVEEVRGAFFAGRCDVYTADLSALAATRATGTTTPDDYVILPEIISKDPLGAMVRHGDNQFADIMRWALYAMVEAEEYGVSSQNVDDMLKSDNPAIRRLLGVTPGMGKALGIDDKWAYNIIKQVGNYGESFERNLGTGSPLRLARGQNALWTQGGLQYAPPIR